MFQCLRVGREHVAAVMNYSLNFVIALTDAGFFCVGLGALLLLYFAFKAMTFALKLVLLLATLAIVSAVAWWYLAGRAL
jgi:hypothetical protein